MQYCDLKVLICTLCFICFGARAEKWSEYAEGVSKYESLEGIKKVVLIKALSQMEDDSISLPRRYEVLFESLPSNSSISKTWGLLDEISLYAYVQQLWDTFTENPNMLKNDRERKTSNLSSQETFINNTLEAFKKQNLSLDFTDSHQLWKRLSVFLEDHIIYSREDSVLASILFSWARHQHLLTSIQQEFPEKNLQKPHQD